MHELSIAHAVVTTVTQALPDPQARVTRVRLCIGRLSGVVPQALHFAYDVATAGTVLAGSTLQIDELPVVINCPTCGEQGLPGIRDFTCPQCGEPCGDIVGGKELEVADVTFDESSEIDALREGVLAKNDLLADGLRGWFTVNDVHVSNWVSSPGSGKTALLEALLAAARQGIYIEPTSATAWAATAALIRNGAIQANEMVVTLCSGNGLKATQAIGELIASN